MRIRSVLVTGLALSSWLAPSLASQGSPIGFAEEFALATDRNQALTRLIPGTEDHFHYACLLAQHEGRLDEVSALLRLWIDRHGRTQRVIEIENRQALLTWERNPDGTVRLLTDRLGLRFADRRETRGTDPDLPSRLDPALLSVERLTQSALAAHRPTLDGFTDTALRALAARNLDDGQVASLLQRLHNPDVANLPALVVRELKRPRSPGFGGMRIHARLTLDQLEQCAGAMPDLLNDPRFVDAWLKRIAPGADDNPARDATVREAWLDRLGAFVSRLGSAHNSLKAHVLHHRLIHDLGKGIVDQDRLSSWLRLPRQANWVNQDYLVRARRAGESIVASQAFGTGLPPTGDDEVVARACLEHLFRDAGTYEPFAEYVDGTWLKRVFAETKILAGVGDMQRWYALIDSPSYYEQLRDRVEIVFPATARTEFKVDEPVTLDVDVKNVDTLIVKLFEIDTFNYYLALGREIDASIELDGLVATEERTASFEDGPLRRVRRNFAFPSIDHPGVWIVELIGNGIASRAVVRKGTLRMVERRGAAGHVIRVLDDSGAVAPDARAWFAGREYAAGENGEILLPYSTDPGTKSLILRRGSLAAPVRFAHLGENYVLSADVWVPREALLPGSRAKLLIRPLLTLDGEPIAPSVLSDPVLTVTAIDPDGVTTNQDVRGLQLSADAELVHEIQVPERIARLVVRLRGRVHSLSTGKDVELASRARSFDLNRIDATLQTGSPLLGRTASGYVLDILGKDGEPKPDRAVQVQLWHRDFVDPIHVTLKTDARGRVTLGDLDGIVRLSTDGYPADLGGWKIETAERTMPTRLQGAAGEVLRVPYPGRATRLDRSVASLFEFRTAAGGRALARDVSGKLALVDSYLELRDLAAGDYELWIDGNRSIDVVVTAGPRVADLAVGRDRILESADGARMHVVGIALDAAGLEVTLAHAGADARVHVATTRYLAAYDPFAAFRSVPASSPAGYDSEFLPTSYHVGREIGEEYRYILERRFANKFPGNMLQRPGLLLNPWALDEWNTAIGLGGGAGGKFGGRGGGRRAGPSSPGPSGGDHPGLTGTFANLAFLPAPARLLTNLRPGPDGVLRVPLADLGDGQQVHVLAVDRESVVYTSTARSEAALAARPRHLSRALDPNQQLAERRRIDFVAAGGTAVLDDIRTSELQTYDSLADVHGLFRALTDNPDLDTFAFVLNWPELKAEEKRAQYSKHACHELHFFLFMKDRPFFDEVVRPYLANKTQRTFIDDWLLGADLARYLDPWAFGRLNVFEKILLARRLDGERAGVERLIHDAVDLLPPDLPRLASLFQAALQSGALGTESGVHEQLEKAKADRNLDGVRMRAQGREPSAAGRPAAAPAAPAEKPGQPEADPAAEGLVEESKDSDDKLAVDEQRRKNVEELYRAPDVTRRYVETHYWHRVVGDCNAELIQPNAFWDEYASTAGRGPFVSTHIAEATGSFAEMMLALAVLDLPFTAAEHETRIDGTALTVRARSPMLCVRQEITAADPAPRDGSPILVSQNFFRHDDRYRFEGNERRDAWVTDEFIVDVVYGCQIVVTNPTSTPRKLDLLVQVPQGAIPVLGGVATRGMTALLDAYGTQAFEYAFYFPGAGDFGHYPAHVAIDGASAAMAPAVRFNAVTEPTRVDTTSWEHLSQEGTDAEVLRYLDSANLLRTDLSKIAWRMRDRAMFDATLERLRKRHVYADRLWAYGIQHREVRAMQEYLRHQDGLINTCGRWLSSPLMTIDPIERRSYEHVEFAPLFNDRAHRFGRERRILNGGLAAQYASFLDVMRYRPVLDDGDWLSATYYLLLQDRVEEALAAFGRVDPTHVPGRLQFDYMRAYLDFFTAEHAVARGIAERYRDHPVDRWRELFGEVLAQLDEAEGRGDGRAGTDDRTARQTNLAESGPSLELVLEGNRATVRHRNLASCEVRYFLMDVEFLFSTHPFVQQGSDAFAYVKPNRSDALELAADRTESAFDLPAEFANANVLIEVSGGGLTRREAHYAHSLEVRWLESYGQLQVTDAGSKQMLPKVYVKVFARLPGGKVRFHKDGYTDLRGRFDYASLSGDGGANVDRYAVLVLSEEHGAVIRELEPPAR